MIVDITEDMVREHFANVQISVTGERTLLQKLHRPLELWEKWISRNMMPEDMIPDYQELCASVMIYGALIDAMGMLDVVLTPNGLATVGNNTLVPASEARSKAVRDSLKRLLFDVQEALIAELRHSDKWLNSHFGFTFGSSLFVSLTELCYLMQVDKPKEFSFDMAVSFHRVRAKEKERKIASRFISHALMVDLRRKNLANSLSSMERRVVENIKRVVTISLTEAHEIPFDMVDTVDLIRKNPDSFRLWHESELAELYNSPDFSNKKQSGGFFF